ncbi:hypothetical protein AAG928_006655 [Enterobacter hormaechei]
MYNGDKVIGTATVQADGTWSLEPTTPLPDGRYTPDGERDRRRGQRLRSVRRVHHQRGHRAAAGADAGHRL